MSGMMLNFAGVSGGTIPGAPTIGTATATGSTSASVTFTAPANNGGSTILSYTAVSSPGGITGKVTQAGSGTVSVSGLSPLTSYTFVVFATNAIGNSPNSASSNSITTSSLYMNASTTGATEVTSGNYKIATFNGTGQFIVSSIGSGSSESAVVDYLVVAGGGAGGNGQGGGGGAGGVFSGTGQNVTPQTYTVTVGAGGAASVGPFNAAPNGNDSSVGFVGSIFGGGGGGQRQANGFVAGNGGSGGGAARQGTGGGSGTPGMGNPGGGLSERNIPYYKGYVPIFANGGGGGAGANGSNGFTAGTSVPTSYTQGGPGGSGVYSSISGTPFIYAGGGGGFSTTHPFGTPQLAGAGGEGGGGPAGIFSGGPSRDGVAGTANTGGGGGGSGASGSISGAGGSGRIIIKWRFQ